MLATHDFFISVILSYYYFFPSLFSVMSIELVVNVATVLGCGGWRGGPALLGRGNGRETGVRQESRLDSRVVIPRGLAGGDSCGGSRQVWSPTQFFFYKQVKPSFTNYQLRG